MKKFEIINPIKNTNNIQNEDKPNKILDYLPNLLKILPQLLDKLPKNTLNINNKNNEKFLNKSIDYPVMPSFQKIKIKNAMDTISNHQYLVQTLRNQQPITGHSPQSQQIDTLPNNHNHQHHLN